MTTEQIMETQRYLESSNVVTCCCCGAKSNSSDDALSKLQDGTRTTQGDLSNPPDTINNPPDSIYAPPIDTRRVRLSVFPEKEQARLVGYPGAVDVAAGVQKAVQVTALTVGLEHHDRPPWLMSRSYNRMSSSSE